MMKSKIVISFLICMVIVGCLSALVSTILYFCVPNDICLQKISLITGTVATIWSLFLSIFATIYGYKSTKGTEETLKKIEKQYEAFVKKINISSIAFGEDGIKEILPKEGEKDIKFQ